MIFFSRGGAERTMEILAIIPARGGSKGLPGKNIMHMHGHPLLAYSILAAQQSKMISRIIVNTDDEAIAEVARVYGAEVPFIRPANLAADNTTDLAVFQHQLEWHRDTEQYRPDVIVQLRPTSPIRLPGWLDAGIEILQKHKADSVRVVTIAPNTPYKMWMIDSPELAMRPLLTLPENAEPFNMPRQQLPVVYWQVGTLDVINTHIIEQGRMSGDNIMPMIIDESLAADIDTAESFARAAQIMASHPCIKFNG